MDDQEYWGMDKPTYLMAMHFAQLAGFLIPMAGMVLPIVMWVMHRAHDEAIDKHGQMITNWIISTWIYFVACFFLAFVFIGFFGFFVVGVLALVYPIVGAIKAKEGEFWSYPLTIKFIK